MYFISSDADFQTRGPYVSYDMALEDAKGWADKLNGYFCPIVIWTAEPKTIVTEGGVTVE